MPTATQTPPAATPRSDAPQPETERSVEATNAVHRLSGAQKTAVLLTSLGVEAASKVLKSLRDDEVERISIEIARLKNIPSDVVEGVLFEFHDLSLAHTYVAESGVPFAREVLSAAMGDNRAEEIMMKVEAAMEVSGFHLLQTVETGHLINFLQNEHPQTAALILAHINPRKAAEIIPALPAELQQEIIYRLATMSKTSPQLLREIEEVIRHQIGSVFGGELSTAGGAERVAEILNCTKRNAEQSILDNIRSRDPELASTIKGLMFVFDDLVHVDDRALQRLLMEIEQRDLALALKAAPDELKNKLLNNVSERVAQAIDEELELMGPVRVSEIDEAQHNILEAAQRLEEQGEIVLSHHNEELFV